jgi:hypothetical protein
MIQTWQALTTSYWRNFVWSSSNDPLTDFPLNRKVQDSTKIMKALETKENEHFSSLSDFKNIQIEFEIDTQKSWVLSLSPLTVIPHYMEEYKSIYWTYGVSCLNTVRPWIHDQNGMWRGFVPFACQSRRHHYGPAINLNAVPVEEIADSVDVVVVAVEVVFLRSEVDDGDSIEWPVISASVFVDDSDAGTYTSG